MHRLAFAITPMLFITSSLEAEFIGPYAPQEWAFSSGPGGSLTAHTEDELILTGGETGFWGYTTITVEVVTSGTWTFDWHFVSTDTSPIADEAFYVLNGAHYHLASGSAWIPPQTGTEFVAVAAGDIIGFSVHTDGLFGPGVLTITNFSAPVPGPGAIALLMPLLIAHRHRDHYARR